MTKAKRDLDKKIKSERRRHKAKLLLELKQAKDNHEHKRYWQLINKNKIRKHRKKSTIQAEDLKTQLQKRDAQQTQLVDRLITLGIEHEQKNTDNRPTLNSNITIEEINQAMKSL